MNLTKSDIDLGLDFQLPVEQPLVQIPQSHLRQYIDNPDIIPYSIRQDLDEQLISTIAFSPEILLSPPSSFLLKNKNIVARYLLFTCSESIAAYLQGDHIFFWMPDGEHTTDIEQIVGCKEEICLLREELWQRLIRAVHDKIRLYFGECSDEYLWVSAYNEQNLEEILEYINKILSIQKKYLEHAFRGEEIHPDDILSLLDNPYTEYDPLDYSKHTILFEKTETTPEGASAEHDWLFEQGN